MTTSHTSGWRYPRDLVFGGQSKYKASKLIPAFLLYSSVISGKSAALTLTSCFHACQMELSWLCWSELNELACIKQEPARSRFTLRNGCYKKSSYQTHGESLENVICKMRLLVVLRVSRSTPGESLQTDNTVPRVSWDKASFRSPAWVWSPQASAGLWQAVSAPLGTGVPGSASIHGRDSWALVSKVSAVLVWNISANVTKGST